MIAPTSFFGDYGCHVRILEEAALAVEAQGHEVLEPLSLALDEREVEKV